MPPSSTLPERQELEYERATPPNPREAKRSLKIGVVALAMFIPVWAVETFLPVNDDYLEYVGLFLAVLVATSVALSALGMIVSPSALTSRRHRHPLAIVGFLLNLATPSLIVWFFYSVLKDS